MPSSQLTHYLDEHHVKYITLSHSPAYTSQEIAHYAHIPGKEMAKTVMVLINGKMAMAVLPASSKVDFSHLKKITGADQVLLASEEEFKFQFPDCEVGAMPPFGNLYNVPVWVDKDLANDPEIYFNACNHKELIKMKFQDFKKLTNPHIGNFSMHRKYNREKYH